MAAVVPTNIEAAIRVVRDDGSEQDWVLIGYEGKDQLKLIGTGHGGIEALKAHIIAGDVCYGLVRKEHAFETAKTVKFVWIYWRPEAIPIARKMKIGIFEGQVKRLFSPYHADVQASAPEELGEPQLAALLDTITMRADRTGNAQATGAALGARSTVQTVDRQEARGFLPTGGAADTANKKVAGAEVKFEDPERLRAAILAVRSDADETNWCLFGYKDAKTVGFVGQGSGGLDDLMAHTQDGVVNYGLFRVNDKFDMTNNVRFCFVCWQPEDVAPTAKARISTHKGAVAGFFREHQPYQFEFRVAVRGELTVNMVRDYIGQYTGKLFTLVGDAVAPSGPTHLKRGSGGASQRTFLGGVTNQTAKLEFIDEDALTAALARVRKDGDDADFVVAGFDGSKVKLLACGAGGVDALVATLPADGYGHALLRLTERIDASDTTKFCYVKWQPESVAPAVRGRLGVLQGAVSGVFHPYHGDLTATDAADVTASSVMKCVSNLRAGGA
ncbi:unnamed protein product [Phaeothamnion confervicola]